MNTTEVLKLALKAFARAERDGYWSRDTAIAAEAIKQALAAQQKAPTSICKPCLGTGQIATTPPTQPASCPHGMVDTCCENYSNCNLSAAPVPLTDGVTVPLAVLEAAEASLGSFCSDLGWSDEDMQNMDNLSAYIARHKANLGITKGQP